MPACSGGFIIKPKQVVEGSIFCRIVTIIAELTAYSVCCRNTQLHKGHINVQIVMPKLNDAGDDGQVDELLVAVGDEVGVGDAVMTVEMEKAVIEIESPHAGTVKHIIVASGDVVAIGQPLMDLE